MLEAWSQLGSAVQDQALAVWAGADLKDQNFYALKMIEDWALKYRNVNPDLRMLLELMKSKHAR